MKNADKPAYPVTIDWSETDKKVFTTTEKPGLSKREMFAMAAMQAVITGYTNEDKCNGHFIPSSEYPLLMVQATQIADELLKQLEQ